MTGDRLIHSVQFSSVAQSCPTLCDPMNHNTPGLPVLSPTPRVYSNSFPSSQWCHPAISSSAIPFSSFPQSLPNHRVTSQRPLRIKLLGFQVYRNLPLTQLRPRWNSLTHCDNLKIKLRSKSLAMWKLKKSHLLTHTLIPRCCVNTFTLLMLNILPQKKA